MKKLFHVSFLSIVFFHLLILAPNNLYSQSYQTFRSEMEQIAQRAKLRIGPFRIYPTIQFRNIGYEYNVYGEREEDHPASDYTATISPQITFYLLSGNWLIFSFSENPEYIYYMKEKRRRAFTNSYSPGLRLLIFQRFVLSGNYQYRKTNRRATSEFDVPSNIESKEYNISFFYETARSTSFGFSWAIRKINLEDVTLPGADIYYSALDREERSRFFEFYYQIFSESVFFIRGGYTEYNFEHMESGSRDSYSYQAYSGIRFPLLGRARGILSLGYKKFMPKGGGKKGFSGLVGNTGLDFRKGRFGFRILYTRDCRLSYLANSVFFLEDRYGTGISFYLSRSLRLDYNFTYGKSNYPEVITIRMPDENHKEIKRQDTYRIHTAGFAVRIIRSTGIGGRVNLWERDSMSPEFGRNRWFVGVYVTHEF